MNIRQSTPTARKTVFSVDAAMKILDMIEEGEALYSICKNPQAAVEGDNYKLDVPVS